MPSVVSGASCRRRRLPTCDKGEGARGGVVVARLEEKDGVVGAQQTHR